MDFDNELESLRNMRLKKLMSQTEPVMKPVTLTEETFDEFIQNTPIVIIDFWAAWCGPCKMVAPILDDLAEEYSGKVWVGKVDTDAHPRLAMKYGATSIPTFWAFKDGKPVTRFAGARPKATFVDVFDQLVKLDMSKIEQAS